MATYAIKHMTDPFLGPQHTTVNEKKILCPFLLLSKTRCGGRCLLLIKHPEFPWDVLTFICVIGAALICPLKIKAFDFKNAFLRVIMINKAKN